MAKSSARGTDKDGEILVALQHSPLEPLPKIARRCGHSVESIRRTVARLSERGVLGGIAPLVNLKPMGFLDVQVFFSWAPEFSSQRELILKGLIEDDRIAWVATLGGEFDVGILIPSRSAEAAWAVLEDLGTRFGSFIGRKSIAMRRSFTAFGRRHLAPRVEAPRPFTLRDTGVVHEADPLDLAILATLSRGSDLSAREVARALGVAHATVDRRIVGLQNSGVIAGWIYRVNPGPLGLHTYRLMIATKGLDPQRSARIAQFCTVTPSVIKCFENIGPWDYEIEVDAREAEHVQALIGTLTKAIGPALDRVSAFQLFRQHKYHGYPFAPPATQ